jgi:hypothetical protein
VPEGDRQESIACPLLKSLGTISKSAGFLKTNPEHFLKTVPVNLALLEVVPLLAWRYAADSSFLALRQCIWRNILKEAGCKRNDYVAEESQ